jgi:glycosyltransferase involved in cell wall biosynthesis
MISVIVPAHKATATIEKAVFSVLDCQAAMHGGVEVVIAPDDGERVYEEIFHRDSRVVVIEPTDRDGPGASRNRAMRACRGRWLTKLDADDKVSPRYLDQLLEAASINKNSIAYSRTSYRDSSGKTVRQLQMTDELSVPKFAVFAGSIHSLYCRSLWIDYPDFVGEDVFVDVMLLARAGGIAPLCNAVYFAQLHGESLCARTSQDVFNAAYREVLARFDETALIDVFATKLSIGTLFGEHVLRGGSHGFHQYVAAVGGI